jgi:hypothetical protein
VKTQKILDDAIKSDFLSGFTKFKSADLRDVLGHFLDLWIGSLDYDGIFTKMLHYNSFTLGNNHLENW